MFDIPVNLRWLEKEIVAYEQLPIEKGKILFYGHSIFTRWGSHVSKLGYRPMEEDIRMKDGSLACVNHGFGTSSSEELLYYYPRMVRPWEPRALVIMTLANDITYGMSVEQTLSNVAKLCAWARADFPGIKIYLVEPHPHPRLVDDSANVNKNNRMIRQTHYAQGIEFIAQHHEDTKVIHLWNRPELFLTPEDVGNFQKIREDIFSTDRLHFNQEGYDVLAPIFREELDELL